MRPFKQCLALAVLLCCAVSTIAGPPKVALVKTPHGGLQPQVAVDAKGTLHLIYFQGEAKGGDLFYVRREAGQEQFSKPLRINSQVGSAVAVGTIRGGQFALGKGNRIHVVWNGSHKTSGPNGHPLFYRRLNEAGTGFEEQRNLMRTTMVLDGGGTVAADAAGNVYAAWHALKQGGERGEDRRQMWLARSTDEGRTFAEETPAWDEPTGACGCCGSRAFCDSRGELHILYRSAGARVNRDMYLLTSGDMGKSFAGVQAQPWKIATCPMSSMSFAEGPQGTVGAWDTDGQIYFAAIKKGADPVKPQSPPGAGKGRKHPALAFNSKGEMLLAWAEGTGWQRGGALAWQLFDKEGRPVGEVQRLANGIPVWGLPAVAVTAEGFTIFH